jgi:transitional endoplasmic reticulum ATPase
VTRPGRLDQLIKMDFPTSHDRTRIFESCFKFGQQNKAMPVSASVDVKVLVERTKGKTGADISAICREAALIALRQDMNSTEITMDHFEKAIK